MTQMTARAGVGVAAMAIGLAVPLFLGTAGFLAVGFGTMTDCTNNYSCTSSGCPPCDQA